MTEKKNSLKDELFNYKTVSKLAQSIKDVDDSFEHHLFVAEVMGDIEALELKERVTLITCKLESFLINDFMKNTEILLSARANSQAEGDFVYASFSEYIERNGCNEALVEHSLMCLGEFTKLFSAEFAIRKFINLFPDETFEKLMEWSVSENVEQRRLSSEGLRPKLPWAVGIDFDYKRGAQPLHSLYYDSQRYVVRSVANHLNDISKIDPGFVVECLKKWKSTGKQSAKEMDYLMNHALRTLIKKGHEESLALIGFKQTPQIIIKEIRVEKNKIKLGESINFSITLEALEEESILVDYKVIYPMASGKTSEKVFKLKKINVKKYEVVTINKKHVFKEMTTKKLYTGNYELLVQINGSLHKGFKFYLDVDRE